MNDAYVLSAGAAVLFLLLFYLLTLDPDMEQRNDVGAASQRQHSLSDALEAADTAYSLKNQEFDRIHVKLHENQIRTSRSIDPYTLRQ